MDPLDTDTVLDTAKYIVGTAPPMPQEVRSRQHDLYDEEYCWVMIFPNERHKSYEFSQERQVESNLPPFTVHKP